MKYLSILALLPVASAFVPAASPSLARGRSLNMAYGYGNGRPVGGVQFFPNSASSWDPCNIAKDASPDYYWRLQHGEIKNGRVAMLAVVHYLVTGLGVRFPFVFGDVSTADIPSGLAAIKALPAAGWLQLIAYVSFLEVITDKNLGEVMPGRVPGNVQPDTPAFKAPGDETIRTKEINNGRLAMMAIIGIWAGELVTGGQQPLDVLAQVLGNK